MSNRCSFASRRKGRLLSYVSAGVLASMAPVAAQAAVLSNPICPNNTAQFDPGSGQDIVVPPGFKVSVFKSGLNFPTGIAFRRAGAGFEVYVLKSGHGLPSRCNDQELRHSGGNLQPDKSLHARHPRIRSKWKQAPYAWQANIYCGRLPDGMAPLSTSRSKMDSTVAACLQPTRTSRCERRGTTTARAL